jgi:hypothetical protein
LLFQVVDTTSVIPPPPSNLQAWGDLAETVATLLALIIGAFWTYRLFVQKRQKYPRANVSHAVTSWKIEGKRRLVRVNIKIDNVGDVLLRPCKGHAWLQVVRPWPYGVRSAAKGDGTLRPTGSTEASWPKVPDAEVEWTDSDIDIEPGETDFIHLDFVVPPKLRTVMVYTYLENPIKRSRLKWWGKREIGWKTSSIHELQKPDETCPTTRATAAETTIPKTIKTDAIETTRGSRRKATSPTSGVVLVILRGARAILRRILVTMTSRTN